MSEEMLMKKFLFTIIFTLLFSGFNFAQNNSTTKNEPDNSGKAKLNSPSEKNKPDGVVRLRVTFLASGEIGDVTVVSANVPDDLAEQAVKAARKIKFEPVKKNGVPQSKIALVEYTFSYSYEENAEDLQKNAEILEKPAPKYPKGKKLKNVSGKVQLSVKLSSDGNIEVSEVKSDLPKEFQDEAVKAAMKIKFKPAIHKNGSEVTQTKEIEYEFKPQKD